MKLLSTLLCGLLGTLTVTTAQHNDPKDSHYLAQPSTKQIPTLFIIGDSTVRNGNGTGDGGQWGWGDFLPTYFNTDQINVVNDALGGTSSRTFYRDRWPGVKAMIKPGDFVIMQFGHNDASPVNEKERNSSTRARGTIDGSGAEIQELTNILTDRYEIVHTYGWYIEQFISETRAHGATPIVCSLIPRNTWHNGKVVRSTSYAKWAAEAAQKTDAAFVNLNSITADAYDRVGAERVNTFFVPGAGPHTSEEGAKSNAAFVVSGLKALKNNPLKAFFSKDAKSIPAYVDADDERAIIDASTLKEETADNAALPTLFLVGDSTVRIGGGNKNGMTGWGERIAQFFDTEKISVINRAIGGRSARTFYTEGRWENVLNELKSGDTIIIQFGHNDGGRVGDPRNKHRADAPGTGPETLPDSMDDGTVMQVHTFGWYLNEMVSSAKAKGATVILCAPVPHKDRWESGRDFEDHAAWGKEVAEKNGVHFIDLTMVITKGYKEVGSETVETFFADKRTHASEAGAIFNASSVVSGIKSLPDSPLKGMFSEEGKKIAPYQP